jgi:hypothetical protein
MAASAAALSSPSALATKAESNRANALLSTGPRTPEGKAASARNATKHGLFTSIDALPAHERAIFDTFLTEFGPEAEAHPALAELLTRWALTRYRIDRCQRLQFLCSHELALQLAQQEDIPFPEDPLEIARLESRAFIHDVSGAKVLHRLFTYESRLNRDLDRIHKEFQALLDGGLPPQVTHPAEPQAVPQAGPPPASPDLASFYQPPAPAPRTPRNANCPCGSGDKFKRCCGKQAPPVLNLK